MQESAHIHYALGVCYVCAVQRFLFRYPTLTPILTLGFAYAEQVSTKLLSGKLVSGVYTRDFVCTHCAWVCALCQYRVSAIECVAQHTHSTHSGHNDDT